MDNRQLPSKFADFLSALADDGALTNYQVQYIYTCFFENPNITIEDILKQYSLTAHYHAYNQKHTNGSSISSNSNSSNKRTLNEGLSSNVIEREKQNIDYACAKNRDNYNNIKKQIDLIDDKLTDIEKAKLGDNDRQTLQYYQWRLSLFPDNPSFEKIVDKIKQKYKQSPVELSLINSKQNLTKQLTEIDTEYEVLLQRKADFEM